ncbi:MAG: alginate export family protein [Candidatus Marinimicrobia bacterium]|nr:alginate export family protein [Candidatus Neomarinimicrobiota bacterium]
MRRKGMLCLLGLALVCGGWSVFAQEEEAAGWLDRFAAGGDLRVRQVYFDGIPIVADPPGVTRGGDNHFFRIRTRLWGQYTHDDQVHARVRLVNEFRLIDKPVGAARSRDWDFPSETLVDQLYLDWRGLADGLFDLRVGRQDLIYGTGKLLLDGTPKDGSRTIYFDAVKLTYRPAAETSLDVVGIYNQPDAQLAVGKDRERDIVGLARGNNDMTESGGVLYLRSQVTPELPAEAYYIYKEESDWRTIDGTFMPRRAVHTVGGRIMPVVGPVRGNFELAGQWGDITAMDEHSSRDQTGMMFDGLLKWQPEPDQMAVFGLGYYYLSGDDPETGKDEGWNPLWARWPQYSELYVYAFDAEGAGRWSNVSLPYLSLTAKPHDRVQVKALAGYLSAPEKNGPGTGSERGWLYTLLTELQLGKNLLLAQDQLKGHLLLEVVEPGDYYKVTDTAYFARWELLYSF